MKVLIVKDNIERIGKSIVIGCISAAAAFQLNCQTIFYRITEAGRTEISSKAYYGYKNQSSIEYKAFIKTLEYDIVLIGFWLLVGVALGLSFFKVRK